MIDVLIVIVLLGTVAGGTTLLFSRLAAQSAQSVRERQALTLAQSLLDEVRLMPFTYCDPGDATAATASGAFIGAGGCTSQVDALGPEPGETRYGPVNRFDGVSDYHGFVMPGPGCPAGLCDIAGNLINGAGSALGGCSAAVSVTPQAVGGVAALDGNGRPQALRIAVSVNCPGIQAVVHEGLRVRHAPNLF